MRHQMGLEMDRAVENMFGGLVAQVKQLLIPVQQPEQEEEDAASSTTSVVVPNGGLKSESTTISPENKVKSVPSDQAQDQNSSVKRCANDSIVPSSDPQAVVRSSIEPELQKQQQIIKNSSIKVEPSDSSVELLKRTTHYAIKSVPRPTDSLPEGGTLVVESCVGTTNTVKREDPGDAEDQSGTNRPVKRQRTESSKDHQADRPETASPPSKFPCETCDKSFSTRSLLKRHSRIHQGAKPYHCKWPDCSYASANSGHILRHIRGLHFKQTGKKGAAQDDGDGDPRDPKEFVRVDKDLLN